MKKLTALLGGTKVLWPYANHEDKMFYLLVADQGDESFKTLRHLTDFRPKPETIAVELHTDRKAPKAFWVMLKIFGRAFGLTQEEVRIMLGEPKDEGVK